MIEAKKISEMVQSVQRRKEAENKNKEMFFSTAQGNHRPRHGSRLTANSRGKRKLSGLRSNSRSKIGVKGGKVRGKKGVKDRESQFKIRIKGSGRSVNQLKEEKSGSKGGVRVERNGQVGEPSESGFEYDYVRTVGNSSR